jgi:hypothetical protein
MENYSLLKNIQGDNGNPDVIFDTCLNEERNSSFPTADDRQNPTRRRRSQRSHVDLDIQHNLPELPTGKDKYFFVSYSSEDSDRVWSYVEDLENRFKLPCVYANRDFQPGKNTQECIKEGMARSFKVLLFLTPNFHQSDWCYHEKEYAFACSVEKRTNFIIPVKLEECEIPSALMPLTYVDATDPNSDVPAKIASALIDTETCK